MNKLKLYSQNLLFVKNGLLFLLFVGFLSNCSKKEDTQKQIQKAIASEYKISPKLTAFKKTEDVIPVLLGNPSFNLVPWSNDGKIWTSYTAMIPFGGYSKNWNQNNMAYELIGRQKEFASEFNIIVEIKNTEEEKEALSYFNHNIQLTFDQLHMKYPVGLNKSIKEKESFYYEDNLCYIYLKKRERIETNHNIPPSGVTLDNRITIEVYTLTIKSK